MFKLFRRLNKICSTKYLEKCILLFLRYLDIKEKRFLNTLNKNIRKIKNKNEKSQKIHFIVDAINT